MIRRQSTDQVQSLFGVTSAQIEQVIALALEGVQDAYCDVYLQHGAEQSLLLDESTLRSTAGTVVNGAGVRVVIGDKTGFSFTDHINITNLKAAARLARYIATYAEDDASAAACARMAAEGVPHNLYEIGESPIRVSVKDKIALLRNVDAEARSVDPRIKNVMTSVACSDMTICIANSLGALIIDRRPLIRLNVQCLAEEGKRREMSTSGGGGRADFALVADEGFWKDHARHAARDAIAALSSEPAPAGEMTVVLGPGWPGVLIHEAVGHGLEGDFNRKGTSAFAKRMGQKVASPLCTIIDDGTIGGRRGSLNVDDEGTPTAKNVLIENGILVGYMHDRINAALMGAKLTGNGRRESYRFAPMPRMTNTYLAGGPHTPEQIITSVEYGLYATHFGGGEVDITNGNFTFSATVAYLIEGGKITRRVKGATLIGNGPKALLRVSMVGSDVALDRGIGTCGKNGQGVPVGVGMPTVRIDNVTVGGTGK